MLEEESSSIYIYMKGKIVLLRINTTGKLWQMIWNDRCQLILFFTFIQVSNSAKSHLHNHPIKECLDALTTRHMITSAATQLRYRSISIISSVSQKLDIRLAINTHFFLSKHILFYAFFSPAKISTPTNITVNVSYGCTLPTKQVS